jgi:hypothetical protein
MRILQQLKNQLNKAPAGEFDELVQDGIFDSTWNQALQTRTEGKDDNEKNKQILKLATDFLKVLEEVRDHHKKREEDISQKLRRMAGTEEDTQAAIKFLTHSNQEKVFDHIDKYKTTLEKRIKEFHEPLILSPKVKKEVTQQNHKEQKKQPGTPKSKL